MASRPGSVAFWGLSKWRELALFQGRRSPQDRIAGEYNPPDTTFCGVRHFHTTVNSYQVLTSGSHGATTDALQFCFFVTAGTDISVCMCVPVTVCVGVCAPSYDLGSQAKNKCNPRICGAIQSHFYLQSFVTLLSCCCPIRATPSAKRYT